MAYQPLAEGTPVAWTYRSATGYGYVAKVLVKGPTAERTKYRIRQVDNHVSATGSREPKFVEHWGSDVRAISRATVQAQAKKPDASH